MPCLVPPHLEAPLVLWHRAHNLELERRVHLLPLVRRRRKQLVPQSNLDALCLRDQQQREPSGFEDPLEQRKQQPLDIVQCRLFHVRPESDAALSATDTAISVSVANLELDIGRMGCHLSHRREQVHCSKQLLNVLCCVNKT